MLVGVNLTQELHNLEEKKSTLEQAVKIAVSLEKLSHGLKAVILMGKPTSSISKNSLTNVEALEEKTKILSSFKLKEILERLEKNIQEKLSLIIEIAKKEAPTENVIENIDNDLSQDEIDTVLKEYLKSAQTALALKVILRSRGEVTHPSELSLPTEDIKHRLTEVDTREKRCRIQVKMEMHGLINDTVIMLARDGLPENSRKMIKAMHDGLELNLKHIEEGKSIDDMPVSIENIVVGNDKPKPSPVKLNSLHSISAKNKKSNPKTSGNHPQMGFFHKLWRWLTSPPSIGWNDVDDYIKDRSRKSRK